MKMMVSKLSLGTVQFGLDYGIANSRGKIPKQEVFEILKAAQQMGLNTLDTSIAYGDSERVIGEFISGSKVSFEIISKTLVVGDSLNEEGMKSGLQDSLQRLNVKQLDGCLIHKFEDFLSYEKLWFFLEAARSEGLVKKIGFSLYRPEELELILDRGISFDIIQLPYSVLDRRFEKYFKLLKGKGIEIHVRSVFLQGVVFLQSEQLPEQLYCARESLRSLRSISERENLPISAICLNYVLANADIDKVIVGIDSLTHFKDNVGDLTVFDAVLGLRDDLNELAVEEEEALLPFKWIKKVAK